MQKSLRNYLPIAWLHYLKELETSPSPFALNCQAAVTTFNRSRSIDKKVRGRSILGTKNGVRVLAFMVPRIETTVDTAIAEFSVKILLNHSVEIRPLETVQRSLRADTAKSLINSQNSLVPQIVLHQNWMGIFMCPPGI
jgi:hypothetical protein